MNQNYFILMYTDQIGLIISHTIFITLPELYVKINFRTFITVMSNDKEKFVSVHKPLVKEEKDV